MSQLLLLVVGFLLTTVVGGLLGYFFQKRAWDHQHDVTVESSHREAAFAVFEELSTLMDKRLYRMRVFDSVLASVEASDAEIETAREGYRQIRYDWNDNLNRNLACVEAYFDASVRSKVELGVYEDFSRLHGKIVTNYGQRRNGANVGSLKSELDAVSDRIYDANLDMLRHPALQFPHPELRGGGHAASPPNSRPAQAGQ
jgi:hypothetical protein